MRASTFVDVVAERAAVSTGRAFEFVSPEGPGEPSLTFPELHDRARAVAALLAERVVPGDRVLVLLPPGLDYVAAFLGCLYAGVVAVPLYPPDEGRYSARHRAVLADSGPAAALVPGAALAAPDGPGDATGLEDLPLIAVDGELPDPEDWRRPRIEGDGVAFLQYTSGSTATPRGVVVTHRNLVVNSRQIKERFGTSPGTGVVSWLPPYHDMGLIGGILQPVYAGATATLFSPVSFITRPLHWLRLVSERGARISGGPDFAYDLCVDRIPEAGLEGLDLSQWDVAFNGAEPVRARTLDRFAARMAPYGFRRGAFFPCYGLAEATLMVSGENLGEAATAETFDADSLAPGRLPVPDESGLPVVSCGPVAEDLSVAVVEPDSRALCPPGVVGEIWTSGENVSAGYWGRRDDTHETFGATLHGDDWPYLRTGDLGFLKDGRLHVTGRSKDLIVVRGRNHYPQDLEQTALDAHPSLRRGAAAFALDDGIHVVLEAATARPGGQASELTWAVREGLAREHGVTPDTVVFVRPGRIPRTTSGKVQRSRIRALFAEGTLDVVHRWDVGRPDETVPAATADDGPQRPARETVLALASRRLAVRVDPGRPLVAQGLDSLAAIELKAAVEDALGLELSLEALISGASVDELLSGAAPAGSRPGGTATPAPDTPGSARGPLAFGQQALWILEKRHPDSAVQHIQVALRFLTEVDADALHRAFQALVDRHPALRTAVHQADDGDPYQEVLEHREVAFTSEDAEHLDDGRLQERLLGEAGGERIDLTRGAPLQAALFRRTGGDVLSLVVHHIAVDLWSMTVLTDELGRLYARHTGRADGPPPPPTARYPDLARRQRAMLASPRGEELWDYWSRELEGCPGVVELPADRPRPPLQSYRGDTVTMSLDTGTTAALRERATLEGTTLFVTLLAVFQTLVHRYTGEDDFLVGVPSSGRGDRDLHGVVGYFVNPVLIRSRMDGDRGFAEQVRATKQTVIQAMRHQEMPFPVLVERLGMTRDASRAPGYQLLFSLNKSPLADSGELAALHHGRPGARARIGELEAESLGVPRRTSQVDLTMVVTEVGDHVEAAIDFSTDLFDRGTVERFGANFAELAARLPARPAAPLAGLPCVRGEELRQIDEWNATATHYPRGATVPELFAEQVSARPDAPALTYGTFTRSYRELDRMTDALARRLRALGVRAETPVALHADREPAVAVAMLAVAKAGGAYVPLDPAHPPHRLRQIVTESRPAVLLTTDGHDPLGPEPLPAGRPQVLALGDHLTAGAAADPGDDRPVERDEPRTGPDGLLYVMYTSGSSGTPKGVCITHRNVVRLVRDTDYVSLAPGDRMAQMCNTAFDAATLEVWGALLTGGHLVGFDRDTVLSPPLLAAALREEDIHTAFVATPLFHQVADYDPAVFATVRQLLAGGDTLDPKHAARVTGPGGPTLINGYGPTESTTFATAHRMTQVAAGTWRLPIGRAIANTRVYVLDERLNPVPVGVPGRLHIGGDGLGRGYLGRPALTAGTFLPDPFGTEPGARMYATGDLARRLPDGTLDFLGRADFQVKVRGFRVEPGDVDAALTAHPSVREAVTVVEDSAGEKRLAAYYAGSAAEKEVAAHLAGRLPEYMRPAVLVRLDVLPKNPSQKIDRAALPLPASRTEPERRPETAAGSGASGLESEVAAMLAEVLGRPHVGVDENFFELGGHSLLAIRLLTRVKRRYDVELALGALFRDPTARAVAGQIAGHTGAAPPAAAAPASRTGGPAPVSRSAYVRSERRA